MAQTKTIYYCRECDTECGGETKVCPRCGSDWIRERTLYYCPYCGTVLENPDPDDSSEEFRECPKCEACFGGEYWTISQSIDSTIKRLGFYDEWQKEKSDAGNEN